MKNISLRVALLAVAGFSIIACNSDDDNNSSYSADKKLIIANYADIAYANYKQAYDDAVVLETAINTFTTTPTDANFTLAKDKWKQSRESYGTTEAFRFANGPIDVDDSAPEGLMNSWPLDESYIDYVDVAGVSTPGGIINNTTIAITKSGLEGLNTAGNETNVSVGYHAIEFLLWGQDLTAPSANKPGQRPYTDYVTGGTATNPARRAEYLKVCADLLTDHLDYLVNQWKPGGVYRTAFLALPEKTALTNIYQGITTLAAAELAEERMNVALNNASQEDEHSCFSDNTHRDIALNLQGVINIYQGKYGSIDGPSLEDLVTKVNPGIAAQTLTALNDSKAKISAILTPFDLAISGGASSTEGGKVYAAVVELKLFGATLIAGAKQIGIDVNTAG